jgi:hypothetical protein
MPRLDNPWEEFRDINTLSGYPNIFKQNPTIFIPLMYRALVEIERFKDRRYKESLTPSTMGFLNKIYRRTLSKEVNNNKTVPN